MSDVIVKLSGGNVLDVIAAEDMEVEVRQYHRDFRGELEDGTVAEGHDETGTYETVWQNGQACS